MATEQGYRVPEVTRVVGITYRQLDYWARTGLVTPSIRDAEGSGSQRLYSFQDLATLRVIKKLLDENNLLVWAVNGEPLPLAHGFPLRLIIPYWKKDANTMEKHFEKHEQPKGNMVMDKVIRVV